MADQYDPRDLYKELEKLAPHAPELTRELLELVLTSTSMARLERQANLIGSCLAAADAVNAAIRQVEEEEEVLHG
jgi:hypothetical protein